MDDPRDDPARSSGFSMASSALMRGPSSDSQLDNQHMPLDSEVEAPARRPRGFLDRMLGRTQNGGHRATASMSILIPPPSALPNDPKLTTGDSAPTSPVSRSRPNALSSPTHNLPSAITPTATFPAHAELSTLNNLSSSERAERVKRNRKLVQILGHELSGADAFLSLDDPHAVPLNLRGAFVGAANYRSPVAASEALGLYRRHSLPISPTTREPILSPRVLRRNFLNRNGNVSSSSGESGDDAEWEYIPSGDASRQIPSSLQLPRSAPPPGTISPDPINLSIASSSGSRSNDEKISLHQHTLTHAASITSMSTTMSNDDDDTRFQSPEDAERARKRATLAKLHRFLGSRVPPEALSPEEPAGSAQSMKPAGTLHGRTTAAAPSPLARETGLERPNDDPVSSGKRKGKWKVAASSSLLHPSSAHIPVAYMSDGEVDDKWSPLTGAQRLHIIRKQKKIAKMLGQCPPGMMKHQSDLLIKGDFNGNDRQFGSLPIEPSRSKQYVQHRYSIDSLTYLVKTNDQDQLQDLLTYIKNYDDASSLGTRRRQASSASSRQQASLSSSLEGSFSPSSPIDSFSHLVTPSVRGVAVEAHGFQQRRKRAEKLSSFFGVEYRELFTEVLDVIESEVQLDSMSGSLSPEETQELLVKLRKLKKA